jgi:hypothetical protein
MRNGVVRRPSNKGLLGKASSTRVARRSTNMTVMTPPNQAELPRGYYDQEYRRDGRPIPRVVEIHYHNAKKSDWSNAVGIAGGTFAATVMGLMLLPSVVTALVGAILFMVLGCLVVALAVSTFRGLSLRSILFARDVDRKREHARSR